MKFNFFRRCLLLCFALAFSLGISAQIPKLISYQGFLTNNAGQALADGSYNVTIKIFDAASGGTELFSETHSVNLVNGIFNLAIGENTSLDIPFDRAYYVSTTIDGTELLPRTAMTASPYSLGGDSKPYALDAFDGSRTNVIYVDSTHRVGIGTTRPLNGFVDVIGNSDSRFGLYARNGFNTASNRRVGVLGRAISFLNSGEEDAYSAAVLGDARPRIGTFGSSLTDTLVGVEGFAYGAEDFNVGLRGDARGIGANNIGLLGITNEIHQGDRRNFAVSGRNTGTGWAGYFIGNGFFGDEDMIVEDGSNITTRQFRSENSSLMVESTLSNQFGILVTNSAPAPPFGASTYGVFAEASDANGIGGRFSGGKAGIVASSSEENGLAAQFQGSVKYEGEGGTLNIDPYAGGPPILSFTNAASNQVQGIIRSLPGALSFFHPELFDLTTKTRVRYISDANSSVTSIPQYAFQVDGSDKGISVELSGRTNADDSFISFFDEEGLQGRIIGQTTLTNVGDALGNAVTSFIDNLFASPGNTSGKSVDPFSAIININWSNESAAPSSNSEITGTDTDQFGQILGDYASQQAGAFFTPEVLVETIMLSADAIRNVITFATAVPTSIFDPEDIFSKGLDALTATANLGIFLGFAIINSNGVAYESSSADYAEWLLRADTNEILNYGEVVGVRAGQISKSFVEADHFMAISMAPAVIGGMPKAAVEDHYEKVAFMGQIPVRVTGLVKKGDYILPSGMGDGLAIAVNPNEMRAKDFHRIVGIAWDESDGKERFKMINTAVGINQNDLADMVDQMQTVMNAMQVAIQEVNPNYEPVLFETLNQKVHPIKPAHENYTVAPGHPSQMSALFSGQSFASNEAALAAVKTAWKEVAQVDMYQYEHLEYIINNVDDTDRIVQHYSQKLKQLQAMAERFNINLGDD